MNENIFDDLEYDLGNIHIPPKKTIKISITSPEYMNELESYKQEIESNKEFRQRCKDDAKKRVEERGGEYGSFWVRYRDETPTPDMEFEDAVTMVLEALNREGVTAWGGDATYIVAQLIYKQYKDKKETEKELDTITDMLYDIREDTQLILDNPHPSIVDCGSANRINNKIDEILKKLEE